MVDRAVRGGLSVAVIEAELAGRVLLLLGVRRRARRPLRPVDLTGEVEQGHQGA